MDLQGVLTEAGQAALLAGGVGAAPWTGAKVGLFTAMTGTPSSETVLSDLTQPTLTGYAESSAVVWGAVGLDVAGNAYAVSTTTKQFVGPADVSGQNIAGWLISQPAAVGPPAVPETLLACGLFPNGIDLLDPLDQINLTPVIGSAGNFGASLEVS